MWRSKGFVAAGAMVVLTASPLQAVDLFVSPGGTGTGSMSDPMGLQAALTKASNNGFSDTLYLQQGTYTGAGASFVYSITADDADADTDLTLSGGWNAAFTVRADDPSLTVLSGEGFRRVLYLNARTPGRTADVVLDRLTLRDGFATDNNGGAILGQTETGVSGSHGELNLTLRRCVLTANRAEDGSGSTWTLRGGAVFLEGGLVAEDTEFSDNLAEYAGAVVVAMPGWSAAANHSRTLPASFTDCEFRDNSSTSPNGGPAVIDIWGNALTMAGCRVHRTLATSAGKTQTIAARESVVTLRDCEFRGNIVDLWASVVDLLGSSADIANCLFENNHAAFAQTTSGGGVITGYNWEGHGLPGNPAELITVTNCTFVGNKGYPAYGKASVLELQSPQEAYFNNCIFKGNDVPAVYGGSSAALHASALDGTLSANSFSNWLNNLENCDPLFLVGDADYHLAAGSPCVDTGDAASLPVSLTTDFEGQPRVFGAGNPATPLVDMGRDEYYNGVLAFTAPAEGAALLNDGQARTIAWTCTNLAGNVRVTLRKGTRDAGSEVEVVSEGVPCTDGTIPWTMSTALEDGADYTLRLEALAHRPIEAARGVALTHLLLTAPNGGQKWRQGSTRPITWGVGTPASGTVKIELLRAGLPVFPIAADAPNGGTFSWAVPYSLAPAADYRVRISSTGPEASDQSNADFAITPAVWLTAPNGGQVWKRGTAHLVTWSYAGNPGGGVRIDLYRRGVFKRNLAAGAPLGTAGRGSWKWLVPTALPTGPGYSVRVQSTTRPKVYDSSDAPFTVSP